MRQQSTVADLKPENQASRVQTHELEHRHCRWPVEGAGAETLFCGADKLADLPYCARHSRMAYHSAPARK
jgi:GcrA cell cycle regulator